MFDLDFFGFGAVDWLTDGFFIAIQPGTFRFIPPFSASSAFGSFSAFDLYLNLSRSIL